MTPRVSVVVPAYNNEAYIAETMHSVLAQTFGDFEVVVADHGSTDRTRELLEPFTADPRVRLLDTPAGGGAERNWNRATEAAVGELVKLVCGDDVLYPHALDSQVAAYDEHGPGIVMVASPRDIIDDSGRMVVRSRGLGGLSGRVPGRTALRRGVTRGANIFGEPCCALLRRDTLETAGGWHGEPTYMIDQGTYSRVLLHGDLVAAPGAIAAFRLSTTQLSFQLVREQADSAAQMHRQLAELAPGTLSATDVRRGNTMARLRSSQRRLVYQYLCWRSKPNEC